ncbi:myo-inositol-1-phosphate synthase [Georgenia yuyongxinii]|uniref:Myo-inositol-1-phosphate synthase n=1 Tax=Georgenia yuyongxinii TaxID=2589797 RepID=A0A5B8C7P1_9MICO|nr:inositol-3-phosphate synthase [Georgenia yuyongxinii]QDC26107.1 myo-inositol-1-phosphate synthase [Georgenia yuyongxinii]
MSTTTAAEVPTSATTGVWFVGARGSVATTATLGGLAIGRGLAARTGMVSELKEVAVAGLVDVERLVFGGHDVVDTTLLDRASALAATGVIPTGLVHQLADDLAAADARVRPGVRADAGPQRDAAEQIEDDLHVFRREHQLDRVVVVDVSSTEPPAPPRPELASLADLELALDKSASPLPLSSLYAYAAFKADCPVVAFTPSAGPSLGALAELAKERGLPWAGRDGKTGETLVKTTLAPMFATRALRVRSWASYNLLGGGDGMTLADPAAAASKTATKAAGIESILGHPVDGPLHIDYVDDLGDWKTAWDHVSFEGFLGTRMNLQFTWQGCDSALAAPLVLDLVRLVARAHELGESGPLGALGFFFKDPLGGFEHALAAQWRALTQWCEYLGTLS